MPQDFKQLRIWQESFSFADDIYKLTASFPKEERYGLTQQLRRAAVSIGANISEGCGKRTNKDFASFLYNSMGSIKECEHLLLFAKRQNFIGLTDFNTLNEKLNIIGKQLTNFIKTLKPEQEE